MNAVRLAVGTLTVFPTAPPTNIDRRVAGVAMMLAPAVGGLLAVPLVVVAALVDERWSAGLVAMVWVGGLAVLTRAMHLDGLADTADGLGSRRDPAEALAIMRRSDMGPFGAATLVLVLLTQVMAVAQLVSSHDGLVLVAAAVVYSRVTIPLACRFPAASSEGLGAMVAGSVTRIQAIASCGLAALIVGGALAAEADFETVLAGIVGPAVGVLFCAWCVRRLGGISGDVLGACVEVAFTASLLAMTLA